MNHFDFAFHHLLMAEGGLLISDSELGGGANMGVSLTVLQEFTKDPRLTLKDLEKLTEDEVKIIYRVMYWDRFSGDNVQGKLSATILLDQSVNRGLGGLQIGLINCLNRRYGTSFSKTAFLKDMVLSINTIPDRQFFWRYLRDCQHSYIDLAAGSPEKMKWLKGWITRTQNLGTLLVPHETV